MKISYVKLAIVLLRVQAILMLMFSVPQTLITVYTSYLLKGYSFSIGWVGLIAPGIQFVCAVTLFILSRPLAIRAVGFLEDREKTSDGL
jgi:hypothetical protein